MDEPAHVTGDAGRKTAFSRNRVRAGRDAACTPCYCRVVVTRVLVVDDDLIHLDLMRRRLEKRGFDVDVMDGPIGATHRIRSTRPEIVLMDINLPGIPGDVLINHAMSRISPETRVFYHSAMDEQELRRLAERDGVAGWFTKSTPIDELVRVLSGSL